MASGASRRRLQHRHGRRAQSPSHQSFGGTNANTVIMRSSSSSATVASAGRAANAVRSKSLRDEISRRQVSIIAGMTRLPRSVADRKYHHHTRARSPASRNLRSMVSISAAGFCARQSPNRRRCSPAASSASDRGDARRRTCPKPLHVVCHRPRVTRHVTRDVSGSPTAGRSRRRHRCSFQPRGSPSSTTAGEQQYYRFLLVDTTLVASASSSRLTSGACMSSFR